MFSAAQEARAPKREISGNREAQIHQTLQKCVGITVNDVLGGGVALLIENHLICVVIRVAENECAFIAGH